MEARTLANKGSLDPEWPELPIEFSRVSANGRLTLVIDPVHGALIPVRYAPSAYPDLESAIENLQFRESTAKRHIGFVDMSRNRYSGTYQQGLKQIKSWCRDHQWDAAIWTALPSNFLEVQNAEFTPERAEIYLRRLTLGRKRHAREYIRNAPAEVQTPLRLHLQNKHWFASISDDFTQFFSLHKSCGKITLNTFVSVYRLT